MSEETRNKIKEDAIKTYIKNNGPDDVPDAIFRSFDVSNVKQIVRGATKVKHHKFK